MPNTSADDDDDGYEQPHDDNCEGSYDNAGYQDLELSTMTSSESQYHGLYAEVT